MEMNEILERLPKHLLRLVIDQPYDDYTAQDHALWRHVMRQNVKYLSSVAHGSYLDGLKRTGISIDRIPHMYGMNRILKEIGWAAVAVDGFIPPSAFMEFQAHHVLVIAADIRPINQIGYTPAPDIIHEAAGHAPIIADPEYAAYLRYFGEVGSKAFTTPYDAKLYEAIRHLSILKADPYSPPEKIAEAAAILQQLGANMTEPSELALIRNLHWWTVEYGLIGDLHQPRIYGAGLLSSISESYYCMTNRVKKIPYTLEAVNYPFDITEPQPQLFVTPDFETLTRVLDQFAAGMAFRTGGPVAVRKAIRSEAVATCVFSSGLQVSGVFSEMIEKEGRVAYVKTHGPTSLCYGDTELPGHGKDYHQDGFGSPAGRITTLARPLGDFTAEELDQIGVTVGEPLVLTFDSGIVVEGILRHITLKEERPVLLSFTGCRVTFEGRVLFDPAWGVYDMAVGSAVVSAFPGPADPEAYGLEYPVPAEKTHKLQHTAEALQLHALYQQVRDIREGNCGHAILPGIWESLKHDHPGDWLCALEVLEQLRDKNLDSGFQQEILDRLHAIGQQDKELERLITDGLELIGIGG